MTDMSPPEKKPDKRKKNKTDPTTHWKKGEKSPNPKGRPKGSKNQKTMYKNAFDKMIIVGMDGKQKSMSLKEAAYHQLAQKAAAGDLKAFAIQKELDEKFDPPELVPPTAEESAADYATFEAYLELRETLKVFKKKDDEDV